MESNREFLGLWIPREIWLDERLSAVDKIILTEIISLDNEFGCIAGNEYFAKFCQCSESTIKRSIKKLIELDLVTIISFDGRKRILGSNLHFRQVKMLGQNGQYDQADRSKRPANNIYNKLDNNKKNIYKEKYKKETIVSDTKDTPHKWITVDDICWDETY